MAIDSNLARFLLAASKEGVSFENTITLGRLNYYLGVKETVRLLRGFGLDSARFPELMDYQSSRYSEPLFMALGAKRVESMDASGFEGATVVHDLNLPVPASLKGQFDVVCDGGTIEHVFNFPGAIGSCMAMAKCGGHVFLATPANNFFGHGFFQFSPELWFRVFSKENGFEVRRAVAVEYGPLVRWYEISDPNDICERVTLINRYPVLLMVCARKTAEVVPFATFPQQSDYVPRWNGSGDEASRRGAIEVKFRQGLLEVAPAFARFLERAFQSSWFNRRQSFRHRMAYRPVRQ